jgi:hypothetical protein
MEVVVVVAGCNVFDGERLGSATKARTPKIAVRAWEGAAAAAAPKVCMTVVGGMHVRVLKAGRTGGGKVVESPKLARILVLHDVIDGHARCLRLLLSPHSSFILTAEGHWCV